MAIGLSASALVIVGCCTGNEGLLTVGLLFGLVKYVVWKVGDYEKQS